MIVDIKKLTKTFSDGSRKLHVLKDINLQIYEGSIITIKGPSGSGKSTLLSIIGTLDNADSGELLINGISIQENTNIDKLRNKSIGFVFQFHQLIPELTAIENIMLPMMIAGKPKKECAARAMYLLQYLGLESRKTHKSTELSGGEQQRIAIGRALSTNPKVILADEPSGNLDSKNARLVHDMFLKLRDDFGLTFVIVTHNQELPQIADRQIVLSDGQIMEEIKKA